MRLYGLLPLTLVVVACAPAGGEPLSEGEPSSGRGAERIAKLSAARCNINVNGVLKETETDYIPHVIACENFSADLQALKAQAIAARSTAYYEMQHDGSICDGQGCQAYTCTNKPQAIHYQAAAETAQQYLAHANMITYGFYVSGDSGVSGPECKDVNGSNTKYVTFNEGKSGAQVTQTKLGWVGPADFGQNRGCMSQNGSRCLEGQGYDTLGILRFYYGDDIEVVTAPGACALPATNTNEPAPPVPEQGPPEPEPEPAPATPNSCQGFCGASNPVPGSSPSCYCDSSCLSLGDCCADFTAVCGGSNSQPTPPPDPAPANGSCAGSCGSSNPTPDGCYCDSDCSAFNDCCADYAQTCN